MDETEVRTRKIEMDQEKIEYMNFAYNEEIIYWKKAALDRILNEREENKLVDLAPPKVLLIRKEKIEKIVNIDEIIFYLESMYQTHNEKPRTFIDDIPTNEPSFETMSNRIKDDENISLKISVNLVDGF